MKERKKVDGIGMCVRISQCQLSMQKLECHTSTGRRYDVLHRLMPNTHLMVDPCTCILVLITSIGVVRYALNPAKIIRTSKYWILLLSLHCSYKYEMKKRNEKCLFKKYIRVIWSFTFFTLIDLKTTLCRMNFDPLTWLHT